MLAYQNTFLLNGSIQNLFSIFSKEKPESERDLLSAKYSILCYMNHECSSRKHYRRQFTSISRTYVKKQLKGQNKNIVISLKSIRIINCRIESGGVGKGKSQLKFIMAKNFLHYLHLLEELQRPTVH